VALKDSFWLSHIVRLVFLVKKGDTRVLESLPNVSGCLLLIFMGTMDCLTTVVGAVLFGAKELNPVLVGLVSSNLPGFIALKLTVTVAVGLIFLLAKTILMRASDHTSSSFKNALKTLKLSYFVILLFLAIVVVNNILVLLRL